MRSFREIEPFIGKQTWVDPTAVLIGDVIVGDASSIWPTAVLRADSERIRVGNRTNIQDGAVVRATHAGEFSPEGHATHIGDNVTIANKAVLQGCVVERNVLVGMGAILMEDVIVHPYCIIGAGSVVTSGKRLESGWLYLGTPAKPIRELTRKDKRYVAHLAQYYEQIAADHIREAERARRRERLARA